MSYQVLTFITTNQSENPLYFSHAEQAAQRYHTIWRLLMANTAVKIENLVKRYGEVIAVDHLNLTIREGEIFGLLGPNGCGKSNFGLAIFDIVYHLTQKFKNPNL